MPAAGRQSVEVANLSYRKTSSPGRSPFVSIVSQLLPETKVLHRKRTTAPKHGKERCGRLRGRPLLCEKRLPRTPSRRAAGEGRWGEAASLREAPLPRPLSRRAAGDEGVRSCIQVAPASWARFLWSGLRSRRLTEPPRPTGDGSKAGFYERPFPAGEGSELRTSAAALSAAVDSTNLKGTAPNSQAEPSRQKHLPQAPTAFREGARGRGLSQKGRLPRSTSYVFLRQLLVQRVLVGETEPSLHRDMGGKSGRLKNSSHTFSANSSAGGMGQKP